MGKFLNSCKFKIPQGSGIHRFKKKHRRFIRSCDSNVPQGLKVPKMLIHFIEKESIKRVLTFARAECFYFNKIMTTNL